MKAPSKILSICMPRARQQIPHIDSWCAFEGLCYHELGSSYQNSEIVDDWPGGMTDKEV